MSGKPTDFVTQAQQIWEMLDDMALSDPESYTKFINSQLKQGLDAIPQPHFCFKTSVKKPFIGDLYINVFRSSQVPEPDTSSDPLTIMGSTPIWSSPGASIACVALNPKVLEQLYDSCYEKKQSLILLCIKFVSDQNAVDISENFEILKGCNYQGNLALLRKSFHMKGNAIEQQSHSDINCLRNQCNNFPQTLDLSLEQKCLVPHTDSKFVTEVKYEKPLIEEIKNDIKYDILSETDSRGKKYTRIEVLLPGVISIDECDLRVSKENLKLGAPGFNSLWLPLPTEADVQRATAKFYSKTWKLSIDIPHLIS